MIENFTIVNDPLIEHVIDQANGKEYRAGEFVFQTPREISEVRMRVFDALKRGEPNIVCSACHTPVYPRKYVDSGNFHFVHVTEDDNNECPYRDKSSRLSTNRIDSMRYNGQKEGPDHKRLKSFLLESINADPSFDPSQTRVEKNWYGASNEQKWRRPDIAASRLPGLRIAFEIQLSSTYLKVIAARREFYLKENALLCWIFKDASGIDPRQYQDDLFFNNNSNLFVVDEETTQLSQENRMLMVRCCYYEPILTGTVINDVWKERIVSFGELTVDIEQQRVYWFDYSAEKVRLIEIAKKVTREVEDARLREAYETFWNRIHTGKCGNRENEYSQLRRKLSLHGIELPERYSSDLERFTQMVFSAREGKGVLTGLNTLLEVANNSYIHGKPFLWYFARVLAHSGNWSLLRMQDKKAEERKKTTGKKHISWIEKGNIIKQKIEANDPEFIQNRNYDKLFKFLFPDIELSPAPHSGVEPPS